MKNNKKGFAAFLATIIILMVSFGILISITAINNIKQRIVWSNVRSTQAYYLAESGIEDSLLRLEKKMNWENNYSFLTEKGKVEVNISEIENRKRNIVSAGDVGKNIRKVKIGYQIDSVEATLHYGAHVGEGGLHMAHNHADIVGNVFSNGNVWGRSPATIHYSVIVSGEGNSVSDVNVEENVQSYSCFGASVGENLEYNFSGTNTCNVGVETVETDNIIEREDFGITDEMMDDWREEAQQGELIAGDYHVMSDETLGPAKIEGDLYVHNNITLTLEGTVQVMGDFTSGLNAVVELDEGYESLSGVMIAEGLVKVANNTALRGSGHPESFFMMIGSNSSMDEDNPALLVRNNAENAILFAPNGVMVIENNAYLVEAMAYKLVLQRATVEYDVGLADVRFSSGPAGGWSVISWKEVE